MKEIKEITDDLVGRKVSCKIGRRIILDAIIVKKRGTDHFGIAQNDMSGEDFTTSTDHGYKNVWSVQNGTPKTIALNGVAELFLLDEGENHYIPFL